MEEIYKNVSINNLENEEWRDVVGYEGLYQISSLGRVKSLKYGKEKILRQRKNKNGYLMIALYKERKMKTCKVHRLVAKAFIDNPSNLPMINHKDENKTNNCVDNLEWCDAKYNINYGTCIQRRVKNTDWKTKVSKTDYKAIAAKIYYQEVGRKNSEKLRNRQDQSKKVYQYKKNGELVAIWESTREVGRNGFDQGNVSKCCNGKMKTHRGYIWSYTELIC